MKTTAKDLLERWFKKLSDGINIQSTRGMPADFNARLDQILTTLAVSISRDEIKIPTGGEDKKILDFIKSRYSGMFGHGGQIPELCEWYACVHRRQAELSDLRQQENWSNSWDHAKTLIYRTATTLMIAAVILMTSFFAQQWGIPLPMLRGL